MIGGTDSTYGRKKRYTGFLVIYFWKHVGKRPLGRPRRRKEDNIKIVLQEVGWGIDWIDLARNRDRWRTLVKAEINVKVEGAGLLKC